MFSFKRVLLTLCDFVCIGVVVCMFVVGWRMKGFGSGNCKFGNLTILFFFLWEFNDPYFAFSLWGIWDANIWNSISGLKSKFGSKC